jgi:hypothetical protein
MSFTFLMIPGPTNLYLFPTQLRSAISRFENQITPIRDIGRKRKYERHQLSVYRGDTEVLAISVTMNDQPFDLSTFEIRAQIRERADSIELIHDLPINNADNGSSFSNGHIIWLIPPEITANLPIKCLFDIRAYRDGSVNTVCSGLFERVDDITRL